MAGISGQDLTTDNDEAVTVIADGQTGSGVRAKVASDGTDDRLYVDAKLSAIGSAIVPSIDNTLRYRDMNASTGGVARDASIGGTYTNIYDEDGSGYLFGVNFTLENGNDDWDVKITVDSVDILEVSTKDLSDGNLYDVERGDENLALAGLGMRDKTFRWHGPLNVPVSYTSNVTVQVRYTKGGSKKFKAGFVSISGV